MSALGQKRTFSDRLGMSAIPPKATSITSRRMGERSRQIIMTEVNIHTVIAGYVKSFDFVLGARGASKWRTHPQAR